MAEGERSLAVFLDFENLALGFQGRRDRFDIGRVLERLVEKGKIVVKKAYADWNRFSVFTHALHEAAIELIEIPRRGQTGKNSADIRLCVDAMDLAYSKEHISTFVIVSGDSDFSPLVSKLKELGKHVIGLGMQDSTSELLRDNCDEFIYYEDLGQSPTLASNITSHLTEPKRKAFALLLESLLALRRENKEVLWSSMIKDTMKRKKPSFNETYHGYRTFSELLEDAQREGIIELDTDKRSRTYVVSRFGSEMHGEPSEEGSEVAATAATEASETSEAPTPTPGAEMPLPARKKSRRRRRRGSGAGAGSGNNGSSPTGPVPVADFQPVEIPPPGPLVGIEVAPSPVIEKPAPPVVEEPRERPRPARREPAAAEVPAAEEPAPAAETEPEPRPRTRRTTTRTPRTPRTTRRSKTAEDKDAAEARGTKDDSEAASRSKAEE